MICSVALILAGDTGSFASKWAYKKQRAIERAEGGMSLYLRDVSCDRPLTGDIACTNRHYATRHGSREAYGCAPTCVRRREPWVIIATQALHAQRERS